MSRFLLSALKPWLVVCLLTTKLSATEEALDTPSDLENELTCLKNESFTGCVATEVGYRGASDQSDTLLSDLAIVGVSHTGVSFNVSGGLSQLLEIKQSKYHVENLFFSSSFTDTIKFRAGIMTPPVGIYSPILNIRRFIEPSLYPGSHTGIGFSKQWNQINEAEFFFGLKEGSGAMGGIRWMRTTSALFKSKIFTTTFAKSRRAPTVGFGILNENRKGDRTLFEWLRIYSLSTEQDYEQHLKLQFKTRQAANRWTLVEYNERRLRKRTLTVGLIQTFLGGLLSFSPIGQYENPVRSRDPYKLTFEIISTLRM